MEKKKSLFARLNSIQVGVTGSQLLFETDGFTLYGVLAHAGVSALEFQAVGCSRALEFAAAVGEVLTQLRRQAGRRLPKKAVLITHSAIIALLDLPVDPAKPRPRAQMSELVRWELEPLFAQQNEIWSIGALLMGRGYLDAAQRREIAAEMALRGGPGSGRATVRFGEVALDLGYITREQIDECLALQERLVLFDDEVISGWVPQILRDGEERESHPWLAAGVGEAMRRQWVQAFRKHGLFLQWIYPQLGTSFGAVEREAGAREAMLVEIRTEQFAVVRGTPGQLAALRVAACRDGMAQADECAGLCHEQMRPDIERVSLAVADELREQVTAGLEQRLQRPIQPVPLPRQPSDQTSAPPYHILASLAGVAAHALARVDARVLPRIEAQPPRPPLWKRRELWPYAAAAGLLLALAGVESYHRYLIWHNGRELARLDTEYEEKLELKKQADSSASEARVLEAQLVEKQATLESSRARRRLLEEVIIRRRTLVPGLLRTIGEAVGDEVLLDLLEENQRQSGFHLTGWALTDTAGQLFINRLNRALAEWNYRVADSQVRSGRGRLAAQGYSLEIWLAPVPVAGSANTERQG